MDCVRPFRDFYRPFSAFLFVPRATASSLDGANHRQDGGRCASRRNFKNAVGMEAGGVSAFGMTSVATLNVGSGSQKLALFRLVPEQIAEDAVAEFSLRLPANVPPFRAGR
jgi:hypothetical protein